MHIRSLLCSELSRNGTLGDLAKLKLNRILAQIPQKGMHYHLLDVV